MRTSGDVAGNSGQEGSAYRSLFRSDPVAFTLFAVAVVAELLSAVISYTWGRSNLSDEILTMLSSTTIAFTSVRLFYRFIGLDSVSHLGTAAALLVLVSKALSLTAAIDPLATYRIVGRDDVLNKILIPNTFVLAVVCMLVAFLRALYELRVARERMSAQYETLRLEVEQRNRTEQALRRSESLYRLVVENSGSSIAIVDADGRLRFANKLAAALFGAEAPEALQGKTLWEVFPRETADRRMDDIREALRAGARQSDEIGTTMSDRPMWFHVIVAPLESAFYDRPCVLLNMHDITARKQAEEALQQQQEQFRLAFENAGIGIVFVDLEARFLNVNPAFCVLVGRSREELLRCTFHDITHPDDHAGDEQYVRNLLASAVPGSRGAKRYRHKDGRVVWAEVHGVLLRDLQGTPLYFASQIIDITERRRTEEERDLLAAAVEQASEVVVITDSQAIVRYANRSIEKHTRYGREETIGKPLWQIRGLNPEDEAFREIWNFVSRGETWRGHMEGAYRDGSPLEEDVTITPIRDGAGEISNHVAIIRDVTSERALERRLQQAQKLEAIGSLAGRIAHDFNNILALILGHAEMAMRQMRPEDPVAMHLARIAKAGNRASGMVKQILAFSRRVDQERRPVSVGQAAREALDLIRASLPGGIEVRTRYEDDGGLIFADLAQVHQVIMNLCSNACLAMGAGPGQLEVEVDIAEIGPGFDADVGAPHPGPYVHLRVADTGCGMAPETIKRIFEPFFTTRKTGEGTGLGLATVHGVVSALDGAIRVSSAPGHGTSFDVYFPFMKGKPRPGAAETPPGRGGATHGRAAILFVDDDPEVLEMYEMMLKELGYDVDAHPGGDAALAAFGAHSAAYDLLLTDQVMPDMTGAELVQRVLALRPDIPVVLMSGFGEGITPEQARLIGIGEYVHKPASAQELGDAIHRTLESRRVSLL